MPYHDIQYCLDSLIEVCVISPDTYTYFSNFCEDTDQLFDSYTCDEYDMPAATVNWRKVLYEQSLWLENNYIDYRQDHDASIVSIMALKQCSHRFQITELSGAASYDLAEHGYKTIDKGALTILNEKMFFEKKLDILRRGLSRTYHDIKDLNRSEIKERIEKYRLLIQPIGHLHLDTDGIVRFENKSRPMPKKDRQILKRSIKFLSKLAGPEPTRIFLGGGEIKFQGKHVDYTIKKTCRWQHGHSVLSIIDKTSSEHLSDVCVYTDDVPILDHVASILLHIQAGKEEDILTTGNLYNVSDKAKEIDYLKPFLPEPIPRTEFAIPDVFTVKTVPDTLVRSVNRYVYDAIEEFVPIINMTLQIND